MKKPIWTALLLMVLCLACAHAEEYGKAVIYVEESTKLHLRAEPSAEAKSKGLYFTGTEVVCLSELSDEWVHVQVGVEEGYMKGEYLRPEKDGEWIISEQPIGFVKAKGTVNLRSGPSTDYKQAAFMEPDKSLLVLGETANHWYYVRYNGQCGYVSAKLITLQERGEKTDNWKAAYFAYLNANDKAQAYGLITLNDDDIPELVIDQGFEAGGRQILTFGNGQVHELRLKRRGFTYLERENRLCNADGVMDQYFDAIYKIEAGDWALLAYGEYYGYKDGYSEEQQRYICQTYVWNGEEMPMEAYLLCLNEVFNAQRAVSPDLPYDHDEMLKLLGG